MILVLHALSGYAVWQELANPQSLELWLMSLLLKRDLQQASFSLEAEEISVM